MPAFTRRFAVVASLLIAAAAACAKPSPLLRPDRTERDITAPDTFAVRFETSRGPVLVEFYRAWAPRGVDRAYYLVKSGFYDDVRFFRVIPRFAAQFGAHGDPAVNAVWERRVIADDPVRVSNGRGTVAFAKADEPNTRTTQLFVNLANNARLDRLGFAPVGRVVDGLSRVDALYGGYGDGPPRGRGPDQDKLAAQGNEYLTKSYPRLDFVRSAQVVRESKRR